MKKKITLTLLVIIIILGFFAVLTALSVKKGVNNLKLASAAVKNQDLDGAKNALTAARKDFPA